MKDPNFFEQVFEVAKLIPKGRVTSYGAIARFLGAARSARMVGWAMNSSKSQATDIPAHRVVNRAGVLTGKQHFGQQNLMAELLQSEGVLVDGDQIVNFTEVFWDPNELLKNS